MLRRNYCTTLTRQSTFNVSSLYGYLRPSILKSTSPVRQFISTSFYKTRAFFRYVFGRNLNNLHEVSSIRISNNLQKKLSESLPLSSKLCRLLVGQENVQLINKSRFKLVSQRFLRHSLSFGLVGVCLKDENGIPILFPEKYIQKRIDFTKFFHSVECELFELKRFRDDIRETSDIRFKNSIAKGCCGVVYRGEIPSKNMIDPFEPVAVKMLFNYDIESNATAIINSTIKECLPYNGTFGNCDVQQQKRLPPHPNIVKILSVFADYFKPLEDCDKMYPEAMPQRYGGFGRNMTLFIVQKLYDTTLREYLYGNKPTENVSLTILTQCMAAIEFLYHNKISHRDLKLDNILVSLPADSHDAPWVVLADFGLCLNSLQIPFQTEEVCRGGNRALMAPEIVNAKPSSFGTLNYTKADLWSLGTIAYEIYGADNPFYRRRPNSPKLDSATYEEYDLPRFPAKSEIVSKLIHRILSKDPYDLASDLCHLIMHMGPKYVTSLLEISSISLRDRIAEKWFELLSYKSVYEIINGFDRKSTEYKMKVCFLARYQIENIKQILDESKLLNLL